MNREKCVHLLDDSDIPGYQLRCVVCLRYWVRGPKTRRIEQGNSLRVVETVNHTGDEYPVWDVD